MQERCRSVRLGELSPLGYQGIISCLIWAFSEVFRTLPAWILLDPHVPYWIHVPASSCIISSWIISSWIISSCPRLNPLMSPNGSSHRIICAGPYQGPLISDKAPKQGQIRLFLEFWLIMPYQNPHGEVIMCGLNLSGLIKFLFSPLFFLFFTYRIFTYLYRNENKMTKNADHFYARGSFVGPSDKLFKTCFCVALS